MIDLSGLGDLAQSGIAGGVLGVAGSIVSSVTKGFTTRQQNNHELAMRAADLKEIEAEAATAEKRIALELEGRRDAADAEIRKASYAEASTRWTEGLTADTPWWMAGPMVLVDCVRGLTRPLLTFFVVHKGAPSLKPENWAFLVATCLAWWFGDRAVAAVGSLGRRK